ncbi:hypothetical protein LNP74_07645 [Klebsiella pneumoniae subsp. pneumoniae]|nr:hypothetical protein [Klebsiella pneumoniae subsp. pneumoniae]
MGTVIVGLTNAGHFIAIGLVDRWGRKPTLILGFYRDGRGYGRPGYHDAHRHYSSTAQHIAVLMLLMFIVGVSPCSAGPLICGTVLRKSSR